MSRLDRLLNDDVKPVKLARDTTTFAEKERLLVEACHPKQRAFLLDPARRLAALTPRGCGKTTVTRARHVRRMLRTPKARCLYIATTRAQAEELLWIPLKEIVDKLGIEASFNETKLRCTFVKNGAQLRLVGADDKKEIEKLRGLPHHEVTIDEAASYDKTLLEHLIFRIIAPRLGDYGGSLSLVGTPGHHLSGTFYEVTRPGGIGIPFVDRADVDVTQGWSVHTWNLSDGAPYVPAMARLWEAALAEKANNQWSDSHPVWKREYLGQWAADDTENVYRFRAYTDDGAEWNIWKPELDPRTRVAKLPPGDWRYVYGLDCGHGDPMGLVIFAYEPKERILRQIYGFEKRGMYAKTIAELLIGEDLNADSPGGLFGATGWPDAIVADTAGLGDALLDELRNVYGIHIAAAEKKNKHDAIELFNGDLIDGRIKVLEGSTLQVQAETLQWAEDQYGKIKENKGQANHSTDAAIYARAAAYHQFKDEVAPQVYAAAHTEYQRVEDHIDPPKGEFDDLLGDDRYDSGFWGNA